MNTRTLVELLHHLTCSQYDDTEIAVQAHDLLPSGSGFDNGGYLVIEESNDKQLTVSTSFHHMDEGVYTTTTHHTIRIYPSFESPGFTLKITGRNLNNVKEHIADVYHTMLQQPVLFHGEYWVLN